MYIQFRTGKNGCYKMIRLCRICLMTSLRRVSFYS